MPDELNIAVFASGRGSNFKAILDAIREGRIPRASIVVAISNNSAAGALALARENNIPAVHINRTQFDTEESFDEAILGILRRHGANFIALAGYMKKIGRAIIHAYKNRIVNIHPALLPEFGGSGMYGIRVHEAVLASHNRVSGATVHIVDEEYDHGPVVLQEQVEVQPDDTADSLASRVLKVEHRLYPDALRLFAEGKVRVADGTVQITN